MKAERQLIKMSFTLCLQKKCHPLQNGIYKTMKLNI